MIQYTRLFENVGRTIAGSLNTALHFLNSFGKTFEWEEFGVSLSASLKGFFEDWDAELTGETLSTFAKGLLEAAKGAIDKLKDDKIFEEIGQKIVDFICGIDWTGIVWDLGGFFLSLADAMSQFPIDLANGIMQEIADKIFGEKEVEIKLPELSGELADTSTILNPNSSFGEKIFASFDLATKLQEELEKVNILFEQKRQEFLTWWDENIGAFWDEHISPWFTEEKWLELYDTIRSSLETKWGEVKEWWSGTAIVSWWEEDVKPWFKLEKWLELLDTLKKSFKTKWNETVVQWDLDIKNWWNTKVSPWFTLEKWLELLDTLKKSFKTKWNETVVQWDLDIKNWWNTKVSPWFTLEKWTNMLTSIPTAFKEAFKNAANFAIDMLNGVIGGVESLVNKAIEGLKELASVINNIPGVDINIDSWEISLPKIPRFEGGGHPDKASLFWANEHGIPELVGTIGNQPAVSSGTEITGIRDAVYTTGQEEASLLRTMVSLLEVISEKELSVSFSDREIAKASERGRADMGYALIV